MAKEKITLTLDPSQLQELRRLIGARSLSAVVDRALTLYLHRVRHLMAIDDWLAEMERDHGPIPDETLEWAAQIVGEWADRTMPVEHRQAG